MQLEGVGLMEHSAPGVDFSNRELTADEHLDLLLQAGRGDVLLQQFLANEAGRSLPSLGGLVKDVDNVEVVGVLLLECVKFRAEKNIRLSDVGEE